MPAGTCRARNTKIGAHRWRRECKKHRRRRHFATSWLRFLLDRGWRGLIISGTISAFVLCKTRMRDE
ncbi:hypothetical protein X777_06236 [Ooceraea biroi]|uniref:Uncharacterized protein n=1 Tax=Ooceraea biroi TaxID=2015173 RepID=A0A026WAP5_OOCBI|nr:hypothetical protein X777_06236 [Ooceraea biroi]